MSTLQLQEDWFRRIPGTYVNPDNVHGFQCVDTIQAYGEAIFGVPWQQCVGWGNAEDLLWGPDPYYWHKIQNNPADPGQVPARGDFVVFAGTPEWGVNPWGHVAVVLAADTTGMRVLQQDGFLQCPVFEGWLPYDSPTTGPVIGWCRPNFDTAPPQDVTPAAPRQANWRDPDGVNINLRAQPSTTAPVLATIDQTWAFTGWVHGEPVTSGTTRSDVWFKDEQGYAWSQLFTDPSTAGLPDLNPAETPLQPHQRLTGPHGAILRAAPDKNGAVVNTYVPDRVLDFKGYIHATAPYPGETDIWFVGKYTAGYVWAGALTQPGPGELPDLTTAPAPPPPPVPAYDFTLAFQFINGIPVEKHPAHSSNVDTGNFPAQPPLHVHHWWGTPPIPFTSPLGEWAREGSYKSPHFQIGENRVAQTVGLTDRAYHAGPGGNDSIGTEIDPRICDRKPDGTPTETAAKIAANVLALDALLEKHYGRELTPILHKNVPGNNTACSPIDLGWLYPGPAAPAPQPGPEPGPEPPGADTEAGVLLRFFHWLVELFVNRKKP
jgi:hypothetical protein